MSVSTTIPESPSAGCTVIPGTSWEAYERFLEENGDRRIPHSYVDGELRIMAPSPRHERSKRWFARLVDALTEELNIPCCSLGSTTLKSILRKKGAEPDEGYMIANAAVLRGRLDYDLAKDPPPDLLIEIDITSPSLKRLAVYAAIGVPEVWIYNGESLTVLLLQEGNYVEHESSAAFPAVPMQEFATWIEEARGLDETVWIKDFRAWVRRTIRPQQ